MTCPSPEHLRELLREERLEQFPAEIVAHLRHCHECQGRLRGMGAATKLDSLLGHDGNDDVGKPASTSVVGSVPSPATMETITFQKQPLSCVGQYELLRRIGRGGGGEVYEALHTRLCKRVAVKLLSAKDAGDEFVRRRFFREMEAIGRLNHPNIVQAYDAGEVDGVLYLAMELVEGTNIEMLARQVGPLRIEDACEIVRQAALGLQHAHEHGMVHRDLKPSNLLMSSMGVKIADLGMALLRSSEPADDRLTGSYVVMGTADYMAPEQVEGARHVDIRADLYSLGCTLYRLLAGHAPFARPENDTLMKKLMAHVHEPAPDISSLRPETPARLKAVLEKLLAKDRCKRFAEPQELVNALAPLCLDADLVQLSVLVSTERFKGQAELKPIVPCPPAQDQTTTNPVHTGETVLLPHPNRRSRQIALAVMASVLVALVTGHHRLWNDNTADQGSENNQADQHTGNSKVQTTQTTSNSKNFLNNSFVNPTVAVPAITNPDKMEAPDVGPIAQRWKREFGLLPRELVWPGRSGLGTWRLDEDLRSLVIQTNKTIRFVSLGELTPEHRNVRLKIDMLPQSKDGEFGFFLGFGVEKNDNPRFARFQAIQIGILPPGQGVVVGRYLAELDGHTGHVQQDRNQHMIIAVPIGRETLGLEIRVRDANLQLVTFCGTNSVELYSQAINANYSESEFLGSFGIFAQDTTVWFSNPQFERNAP